eukprot:IDg19685t1
MGQKKSVAYRYSRFRQLCDACLMGILTRTPVRGLKRVCDTVIQNGSARPTLPTVRRTGKFKDGVEGYYSSFAQLLHRLFSALHYSMTAPSASQLHYTDTRPSRGRTVTIIIERAVHCTVQPDVGVTRRNVDNARARAQSVAVRGRAMDVSSGCSAARGGGLGPLPHQSRCA